MRLAVERLQEIFDSLDYLVAMFDRDCRYIYLNREAARMTGRSIDELLGQSLLDVLPGPESERYCGDLTTAATSGRALHRDHLEAGTGRWFEQHFYPTADGVLVLARDVSAEREATEALRRRETMLRLAQQSAGIATFEWDFDRRVARCSAEFFRMFGLPAVEGEMRSEDFEHYVHPLDRELLATHLARTIAGLEPAALDYRIVTADGRIRWLSYAGQLHHTAGNEARMLGAVVDVTHRKTAEEELRHRDERHRAFMATSTEAIWRFEVSPPVPTSLPVEAQVDAFFEGAFLAECNEAMAHMYGFANSEELVGTRLADMMPASDPVNREYLRMFAASGYRLTGHVSHEKDRHGRSKFFRNSLVGIVEDGAIVRAWGTQTDITDVKVAQERASFLAAAGKALAGTLDFRRALQTVAALTLPHLADWCVIDMIGDDGTIERLVTAHRDSDGLAKLTEIASRWPVRLVGPLAEAVRSRRAVLVRQGDDDTLRAVAQDAEHLALLRALDPRCAIVAPVVARERVIGAISLVLSESGRTFDEGDVGLVEDLASRTGMAIDNSRLYEEAQAASRAKDDFLARLSHELRTPLNAVLGWTLMLRGVSEPSRLERGLDVIDRNARALSRIIEDLLDFSRNVRGGLRIEAVPTDLRDVARQAIMSVAPLAVPREISIRLTAGGPMTVRGDAARLQQVVWNLLTNAIKFTSPGGSILVELEQTSGLVRLAVRDTGPGVRAELMPTMFDPFRQGEAHGTPGLGLGLAIVRQIVEAHGGTVDARNAQDGPGAIFEVRLPDS